MELRSSLIQRILTVRPPEFEALALDIGRYQYRNNPLFRQYCELLDRPSDSWTTIADIPFLPIQFFKQSLISSNAGSPQIVFESSSTGGVPSRHGLWERHLYSQNARRGFRHVVGSEIAEYHWCALLPSYLERPNASLVYMVQDFIAGSSGGFYLDDLEQLARDLQEGEKAQRKTILLGVSFALLDFADGFALPLRHTKIFETGGMKGRRDELTRDELHARLQGAFGRSAIGSEYGMTELLSQAWSVGRGVFFPAPTLRIVVRDIFEPTHILPPGRRGAINCIDLANIDSCSFIATDDVGISDEDGSFRVLGRLDGSEQRGCNLMVSDVA